MLASVRSLRAAHPHRAATAQRLARSSVPALVAAAARQSHVARSFSSARALSASQSPDTFMTGTNASYAQAQFEAWQEVSSSSRTSASSP